MDRSNQAAARRPAAMMTIGGIWACPKPLALLCASAATAALLVPVAPASAQQPEQTAQAGAADIIVTAQRREQSLLDVPMSVTALGGEELAQRGITNFVDYATIVPSVSFGFSGAEARGTRNTIAIRGISGVNTVGYYIDDTPVPFGVDPKLFDVARVEVLRGPQGTLFGSGSMGGTIRVITQDANAREVSGSASAEMSVTQEGGLNANAGASINLPIVEDILSIRVSPYIYRESGIYDRIFGEPLPYYPGVPVGPVKGRKNNIDSSLVFGTRGVLNYTPGSVLSLQASVQYQLTEEDGATQADTRPGNFKQFRTYNIDEKYDDIWVLASFNGRLRLDDLEIVSSTSYFRRDWKEAEDITEVIDTFFRGAYANPQAPPFPMPIYNSRYQDRFVQEIRLSYGSENFDVVAGGFYQFFKTTRNATLIPRGMAANPDYVDFGVNDVFFVSDDSFTVRERALFGDVTFRPARQVELSAGVRYFNNEVSSRRVSGGLFDAGVNIVNPPQKDSGFTPRFAARYSITEDSSVYATVSKGFRLGGINGALPNTCAPDLQALGLTGGPPGFKSDSLWNYEAGVRGRTADRRVLFSVAGFIINWSDIQQSVRLPRCGFSFTDNVGEAKIKGFEVETSFFPADGLELGVSASLNDAKITDPGVNTSSKKGDELLNSPRWKAALNFQYNFMAGSDLDPFFRADYQYFGKSWSTFNQSDPTQTIIRQPYLPRPAFQTVNIRAGIQLGPVSTSLFVNNLFNEHANLGDARSIGLEFPGRPRWITNRPRTFGLSASARF